MIDFSVESDGEGPRSKFEREDGQTDGGKNRHVRAFVRSWCHTGATLQSWQGHATDYIYIFVISRNQPVSSDDMMLTRR